MVHKPQWHINYLRMFGLKKGNVCIHLCMIGVGGGGLQSEITADSKCLMNNVWKQDQRLNTAEEIIFTKMWVKELLTELSNNKIKFLKNSELFGTRNCQVQIERSSINSAIEVILIMDMWLSRMTSNIVSK